MTATFDDLRDPIVVYEIEVGWYYEQVDCLGLEKEFNRNKIKPATIRIFDNGILRVSEKSRKNVNVVESTEYDLNNCLWFWTNSKRCIICTFDDSLDAGQNGKHYNYDAIDKLRFTFARGWYDKNKNLTWRKVLNDVISSDRYSVSNGIIFKGLLLKRGDYMHRWRDRWFVLTIRGDLLYFKIEKEYIEFVQTQFIDREAYYKTVDKYFKNNCHRIRLKNEDNNQFIIYTTKLDKTKNGYYEFEIRKRLKGSRNDFETIYRLRTKHSNECDEWIKQINIILDNKKRKSYAQEFYNQFSDHPQSTHPQANGNINNSIVNSNVNPHGKQQNITTQSLQSISGFAGMIATQNRGLDSALGAAGGAGAGIGGSGGSGGVAGHKSTTGSLNNNRLMHNDSMDDYDINGNTNRAQTMEIEDVENDENDESMINNESLNNNTGSNVRSTAGGSGNGGSNGASNGGNGNEREQEMKENESLAQNENQQETETQRGQKKDKIQRQTLNNSQTRASNKTKNTPTSAQNVQNERLLGSPNPPNPRISSTSTGSQHLSGTNDCNESDQDIGNETRIGWYRLKFEQLGRIVFKSFDNLDITEQSVTWLLICAFLLVMFQLFSLYY